MEKYVEIAKEMVLAYGPKLLMALVTLVIGLLIVRGLVKGMGKVMEKRKVDPSLQPFLRSMVGILLRVMLFITVAGMLGIEMTSFIAILGAAGLAIGMALSGTLQNFAGGVMLLLFKPFKVGDFIEAQGFSGVVKEILIFNTILNTGDNKTIILANGPVSGGSIVNYSTAVNRRVDWTFGIGYKDDIDKARAVISTLLDADTRILKDPAALVAVSALADSSVNMVVRGWVKTADYWDVFFALNESVKKSFDKEGITIPYPQMDVHQYQG